MKNSNKLTRKQMREITGGRNCPTTGCQDFCQTDAECVVIGGPGSLCVSLHCPGAPVSCTRKICEV